MESMSLPDLAALAALALYAISLLLCFFEFLKPATLLSWVAFCLAGLSGTVGAIPFVAFALLTAWRDLDSKGSTVRALCFSLVMMLALFRVIPGIGSLVIQTPEAANFPFTVSWSTVIVAWLVYSGHARLNHRAKRQRPWSTLVTLAIPLGLAAAIVTLSFQWKGPIELPVSPGWLLTWVILDLVFVSVADESLFRGLFLNLLIQALGNRKRAWFAALLVTSFMYALQHLIVWGEPFWGAFTVGILFGSCFLLTGFLEASILAHFFRDLLLLLWGFFGADLLHATG